MTTTDGKMDKILMGNPFIYSSDNCQLLSEMEQYIQSYKRQFRIRIVILAIYEAARHSSKTMSLTVKS